MYVVQECGQKWYRPRSWRVTKLFRKGDWGFAVGPIMFIYGKKEYL